MARRLINPSSCLICATDGASGPPAMLPAPSGVGLGCPCLHGQDGRARGANPHATDAGEACGSGQANPNQLFPHQAGIQKEQQPCRSRCRGRLNQDEPMWRVQEFEVRCEPKVSAEPHTAPDGAMISRTFSPGPHCQENRAAAASHRWLGRVSLQGSLAAKRGAGDAARPLLVSAPQGAAQPWWGSRMTWARQEINREKLHLGGIFRSRLERTISRVGSRPSIPAQTVLVLTSELA